MLSFDILARWAIEAGERLCGDGSYTVRVVLKQRRSTHALVLDKSCWRCSSIFS